MRYDIHQYPLLEISDEDSNATVSLILDHNTELSTDIHKKLHKTCIALRQLYHTRDPSESAQPDGSLGGDYFGISQLKDLLQSKACQKCFDYTSEDVESYFDQAINAEERAVDMATFVRWGTDIAIGTLYHDSAKVAKRGNRGAAIMKPVQERLQQHTQNVYAIIDESVDREHSLLLQLLRDFLDIIKEHHTRVPHSKAGLEEVLIVGDETTFVRLGSNTPVKVRELYETMVMKARLPMHQFLGSAEVLIERQLMEQKHPMPIEHAVSTLALAIPTLDPQLLQHLPVQQWVEWAEMLYLEKIGEFVASKIKARLDSQGLKLQAPGSVTPVTGYVGSPARRSSVSEAPTCQMAQANRPDTQGAMHEPISMFGGGWGFMSTVQKRQSTLSDDSGDTVRPRQREAESLSQPLHTARIPRSERSRTSRKQSSASVARGPSS